MGRRDITMATGAAPSQESVDSAEESTETVVDTEFWETALFSYSVVMRMDGTLVIELDTGIPGIRKATSSDILMTMKYMLDQLSVPPAVSG